MAVKQWFTIDLPEGTIKDGELTLERAGAESLFEDLRAALGLGSADTAQSTPVEEILQQFLDQINGQSYDQVVTNEETGRMVSPEEALARMQMAEQMAPSPAAARNPGTGIGNG